MSTIDLVHQYPERVAANVDDQAMSLQLPTDAARGGPSLEARLHRPAVVRDALLAIADVLGSDLRRKASDRSDYLAYLASKGKGASKAVWEAQREYLRLKYSEAAREEEPLDPVLTVAQDALRLEVMSRDESMYALLTLRADHAYAAANVVPGTTHLDLQPSLMRTISRIRTYRPTSLGVGGGGGGDAATKERSRRVPLRWLRAFGQMQSASLLPGYRFELAPIDLYNVLFTLRMRKAKKPPRGLRYELVPGELPRVVIEPWDLVLTATGAPYEGAKPMVVRTWGRNRLSALARVLPHARRIEVHLLGAGLPAFYVVELGDAQLTVAMSGWTDGGWAGVSTFDLLAASAEADVLSGQVQQQLAARPTSLDELVAATGRGREDVRRAVLGELGQLRAGHDLGTGLLFARPLLAQAVPADALRFRDAREEEAHRLLAEAKQVTLLKVHDAPEGRTIEGQVEDKKAVRTFYPAFTLDREGRTSSASCTCPAFRRSGIKEGPCEHMIAVRVLFAREQARLESARGTPEGRRLIFAETRTLTKRTRGGTEVMRLSLDGRHVVARFGAREPLRMQRLRFTSADAARDSYFARLDELSARGYLDGGSGD
ncbi:MAG: SWIM zinc finger family protein [Kofleriaceae bacterium]